MQKKNWFGSYVGEAVGTFTIILFGCGLLHVAILHDQVSGLFQASIGWGLAVALAVWFGGALSGAHFNPGVPWHWPGDAASHGRKLSPTSSHKCRRFFSS